MANTYSWRINALNAKIKQDDLDNVIYTVHWSFNAQDDSEPPIKAGSVGTLGVEYKEGDPFIEYADLKKSDVEGWLEAGLEVDDMKQNLDKQIELKKNPVDETLYPDWS